jgi:hypothetical protein
MIKRILLSTALLGACEEKKPAPPAAVTPSAPLAVTGSTEKTIEKTDTLFVLTSTAVKREGSDKPKVDDGKGKQVSNWLGTLSRGERLTLVTDDGGDYVVVKTSGEVEGYVKRTSVLMTPGATEATVLEAADAFDRPDLLALNSKKKIIPGTLVFVVKTRDQFSEVNAQGTGTIWTLSGRLTTDKDELAVAKLLAKVRSLKDSKDEKKTEAIGDLLALAKNHFGNAKLAAVMESEINPQTPEVPSGETAKTE